MPQDDELRIAHISDLHFTSAMGWPPANDAEAWVSPLKDLQDDLVLQAPHLLVVTGDVADNAAWEVTEGGLTQAWSNARAYLESLVGALYPDLADRDDEQRRKITAERLLVIPGNHDARILGNVSRAQLEALTRGRLFRWARWPLGRVVKWALGQQGHKALYDQVEVIFDRRLSEALQALPAESSFATAFEPYATHRALPGLGLFVFCVDSNVLQDSWLNFAQGAVAQNVARGLRQQVQQWQSKFDEEYRIGYKIVLVHHHPMPMPHAEDESIESDSFHLLQNAGSFLQVCADAGVDLVLHGHKHARGCSVVSFPRDAQGAEHLIAVVGAGSVTMPWRARCSYNLIRRRADGEWRLEVRMRDAQRAAIRGYEDGGQFPVVLISRQQHRARLVRSTSFPIRVQRADVLASIDETGNFRVRFFLDGIAPIGDGVLPEYPVALTNESRRATLEAIGFVDESLEPNSVTGKIRIEPPARRSDPASLNWGVVGIGSYTFSKEYCRLYKDTDEEQFTLQFGKLFDQFLVDLTFPYQYPPIEPAVQVVKLVTERARQGDRSAVKALLETGDAIIDRAETEFCRTEFRYWPEVRRISLTLRAPLPDRIYAVIWQLPDDEYRVLPTLDNLRGRVADAIRGVQRHLQSLEVAANERGRVHAFLERCGRRLLERFELSGSIRVDVATLVSTTLEVQAAVQGTREAETTWQASPMRPPCSLGETLRGKAFLQREVRTFSPASVVLTKDPDRHPTESITRAQIAVPLAYPPELPYWPRVGVLTFSWDFAFPDQARKALEPEGIMGIVPMVYEEMIRLAADLGVPFPEVPELADVP